MWYGKFKRIQTMPSYWGSDYYRYFQYKSLKCIRFFYTKKRVFSYMHLSKNDHRIEFLKKKRYYYYLIMYNKLQCLFMYSLFIHNT